MLFLDRWHRSSEWRLLIEFACPSPKRSEIETNTGATHVNLEIASSSWLGKVSGS